MDGAESLEGRALTALGAFYHCGGWLLQLDLNLIDVTNEDVAIAVQALRWERGVEVKTHPPSGSGSVLERGELYAAIAFRGCGHLRLAQAAAWGIPTMLAVQFPRPEWRNASTVLRQSAAFDPRVFAADLYEVIRPWL